MSRLRVYITVCLNEIFVLSFRLVIGSRFFFGHLWRSWFFSVIFCWMSFGIVLEGFLCVKIKMLYSFVRWMDRVMFSMNVSMKGFSLIITLVITSRLKKIVLSFFQFMSRFKAREGRGSRLRAELGCGRNIIHLNYVFVWRRILKLQRYWGHWVCNVNWLESVIRMLNVVKKGFGGVVCGVVIS